MINTIRNYIPFNFASFNALQAVTKAGSYALEALKLLGSPAGLITAAFACDYAASNYNFPIASLLAISYGLLVKNPPRVLVKFFIDTLGVEKTAKLFIQIGANLNAPYSQRGLTLLFKSCQEDYPETVKSLIENGADINIQNTSGETPLHNYILIGSTQAKFLLESGANLNIRDARGQTPVHIACNHRHQIMLTLFTEYHPDLTIQDNQGRTPAQLTTDRQILKLVKPAT